MDEFNAALRAAKIGGRILRKHFKHPNVYSTGYRDVVTDADLECERELKKFFAKNFPYHGFLGEETARKFVDGKNWVVDPLDGTREFAYGIPYFSVSIALFDRDKALLGVVYNPVTDDLYTARVGGGAFHNREKIACGSKKSLSSALGSGCFLYTRPELAKFAYATKIFLLNYSPALDLCSVASGRIDAVVYSVSSFTDHSAASLIAQEAGAVVSNYGQKTFSPFGSGVMAANSVLHKQILRVLPKPFDELTSEESQYTARVF